MPRSQRVEIVREVEAQIYELLGECERGREGTGAGAGEEVSRQDVLSVLGRLDPPEAYLPDEAGFETGPGLAGQGPGPASVRAMAARPAVSRSAPAVELKPRAAKASGIVGIVTLVSSFLLAPLLILFASVFRTDSTVGVLIFWIPTAGSVFVAAIVAIVLAAQARLRNGWAITGLCTGIGALLVFSAKSLWLLLEAL